MKQFVAIAMNSFQRNVKSKKISKELSLEEKSIWFRENESMFSAKVI